MTAEEDLYRTWAIENKTEDGLEVASDASVQVTEIGAWVDARVWVPQSALDEVPELRCMLLSCRDANGQPVLRHFKMRYSKANSLDGEHYEQAEAIAVQKGYQAPFVCFDDKDMPSWLLPGTSHWNDAEVWELQTPASPPQPPDEVPF